MPKVEGLFVNCLLPPNWWFDIATFFKEERRKHRGNVCHFYSHAGPCFAAGHYQTMHAKNLVPVVSGFHRSGKAIAGNQSITGLGQRNLASSRKFRLSAADIAQVALTIAFATSRGGRQVSSPAVTQAWLFQAGHSGFDADFCKVPTGVQEFLTANSSRVFTYSN